MSTYLKLRPISRTRPSRGTGWRASSASGRSLARSKSQHCSNPWGPLRIDRANSLFPMVYSLEHGLGNEMDLSFKHTIDFFPYCDPEPPLQGFLRAILLKVPFQEVYFTLSSGWVNLRIFLSAFARRAEGKHRPSGSANWVVLRSAAELCHWFGCG